MNEFLANLYKTAENIGAGAAQNQPSDDTEKLAQAHVLGQMFKNDGHDIGNVPDATILKVASEIFGPDNEIAKLAQAAAPTPGTQSTAETDEEKVAKADYLGRVMAHSMVQELHNIEKEAGAMDKLKNLGGAAAGHAKNLGGKLKNLGSSALEHGKKGVEKGKDIAGKAGAHVKEHKATYGAGAGGAAVGAAAGEAHGRSKHGSAVDILAHEKATAILRENGIDPEKVAAPEAAPTSDEEKLAMAVDTRTRELLAELGYTVE